VFAPKMAKAPTKAPHSPTRKLASQPSTLGARPLGGGAVEQARTLQGTIGNPATLRHLEHRLSNLPTKGPAERNEQEAERHRVAPRGISAGSPYFHLTGRTDLNRHPRSLQRHSQAQHRRSSL
jgi:hypothetical protein